MLKRLLIVVHRWLGVALCLVFLLWFPSGIGMMYWDFPSLSAADRLARSPALHGSQVVLSPADAYARLDGAQPPAQVRLSTFDGRPVYRFRDRRGDSLVYADTGERQVDVPKEMMQRAASAWTGLPAGTARVEAVTDVDQWTVQGALRNLRPLWKYSWPDGQQVYISGASGEVVQYTTKASRMGAYLGPIPHWLYFTPLRKHPVQWSRVVVWLSGAGTVAAILGVAIGIWVYSPSKRYRYAGTLTSIPYQGQKRWHMILGLCFGLAAATWAFSGLLSMDPFPVVTSGPAEGAPIAGSRSIPQALRGPIHLEGFAARHPRDVLAQLADLQVAELELVVVGGEPAYLVTLAGGDTRIVPVKGEPRLAFDPQRIIGIVTQAAQPNGLADIRVLERYDRYYLDRRRRLPLPVVLARVNDADRTRYYVDPKTARIAGTYNSRDWVSRWLYHGLHSLDFPWLYDYRPAWDIVVIAFMAGGTALCVTALILAWGVLGRKLKEAS